MLSEKTWKIDAVARMLLAWLTTFFLFSLAAQFLNKLGLSPENEKLFQMILAILGMQGAILVWVAFFLREQQLPWNDAFGFSSGRKTSIAFIGVVCGMLVLPIAWLLQQFSAYLITWSDRQPEMQPIVKNIQSGEMPLNQQIFMGFTGILLAPVAEEVLFRGILYPTIKQLGFPKAALWGTAILFAAIHVNLLSFVPLIFLAVFLTSLYERTNNLLAPILAHSIFNAANFVLLLYEKPITRFLERFT